jgi:hypothetical protein
MSDSCDEDEEFLENHAKQKIEKDELAAEVSAAEEDEVEEEYGEEYDDDAEEESRTCQLEAVKCDAYVISNRVAYSVPYVKMKSGESGRVVDYNECIVVENALVLGSYKSPKSWPAASEFPIKSVVVIKGRLKEGDKIPQDEYSGDFLWYARLVIKGKENGQDKSILKLIPKQVVKALRSYSRNSGEELITRYVPAEDNGRDFPAVLNNWPKATGVKSEGVIPKPVSKTPALTLQSESNPKRKATEEGPVDDALDAQKKKKTYIRKDQGTKQESSKETEKMMADDPAKETLNGNKAIGKANASKSNALGFEPKKTLGNGKQDAEAESISANQCEASIDDNVGENGKASCSYGEQITSATRTCNETIVCVKNASRTHTYWDGNKLIIMQF